MELLPEGKSCEAWEPANQAVLCVVPGALDRKVLSNFEQNHLHH
jgi:hypothetical protein